MGVGYFSSLFSAVMVVVLTQTQPRAQAQEQRRQNVRIDVSSVLPEREDDGDLRFRIRLRVGNLSGRPIWIESMLEGSRQPYFVRYEKSLTYGPQWLHLWPFFDAPPEGLFEIKPGQTMEFEDSIPSVSAYRMLPEDGIPIRGVHRARLRYYYSRKDGELARLVGTARKAKISWAVSEPFRIDWPPDAQWPSGKIATPKP